MKNEILHISIQLKKVAGADLLPCKQADGLSFIAENYIVENIKKNIPMAIGLNFRYEQSGCYVHLDSENKTPICVFPSHINKKNALDFIFSCFSNSKIVKDYFTC